MMLTPSQKLDDLINRGFTPRIGDVVDLSRYKYVWSAPQRINVGKWSIYIPKGLMSDGASFVPDRLPEAFFAHDRLYLSPYATYKGKRKRLNRSQCDFLYARIGLKRRVGAVVFEGLMLCAIGRFLPIWKNYRTQNEDDLIQSHTVPRAACWDFISTDLCDAVWVGFK